MERIVLEVDDYDKEAFVQYLDQLRDKMAERGLTEEVLADILNEK
jgi:hypothetical protein